MISETLKGGKFMKKLLSLFIAIVMLLTLVACSTDGVGDDKLPETNKTEESSKAESETVKYDITVSYDDRYTFSKDVESFSDVSVTSKVAGTENSDSAIVTLAEGSKTEAVITGVGTVKVNYADGTSHLLISEPAKISVLLVAGQSNAEGADGSAYKSIKSPAGTVYSTYAPAYHYDSTYCTDSRHIYGNEELFTEYLDKDNGKSYVASSLTSTLDLNGNELKYKLNALTEEGTGKGGLDSSIADQWRKQTGEKVWIVNCAHSGSIIETWQKNYNDSALDHKAEAAKTATDRRNQYTEMDGVMQGVISTMEKELAAGHYTLSHYGLFWCQGESDASMRAIGYDDYFVKMYKSMKEDWKIDGKSLEFASIVVTRTFARTSPYSSSDGVYTYADTELNGVRIAQLYLGFSTKDERAEIFVGTNAGDRWVDKDTYVEQYFKTIYPDEEEFTKLHGYARPTTMKQIHYAGPHYTQEGYNELGRDAVRNTLAMKGWTDDVPPAISNFGDMSVPNIYELYKAGTYAQISLSEFQTQIRNNYYTTKAK